MITVGSLHVTRNRPDGSQLPVLAAVSFAVEAGALLAVIGPSGCGKSTLLYVMAGLLPATSGCVCFDGQPVLRPGPERLLLFQQDSLFAWRTVLGNLTFGLKRPRAARDQALRLLAELGLAGFDSHLPEALSGGMRQRVELARALMHQPRLLLLDEPFAALDALTREDMQDLLRSVLAERRLPMVLVTHDVSEAAYLADRILVLGPRPATVAHLIPTTRPGQHSPAWREDPACVALAARLRHLLTHSEGLTPGEAPPPARRCACQDAD